MTEPMPEPTDHLPTTRRAALRDMADLVSAWPDDSAVPVGALRALIRERAESYPAEDAAALFTRYDDDGTVSVAWTDRGPVVVAPDVVEGWVERVNGLAGQVERLRSQLMRRTGSDVEIAITIGDMPQVREALEQAAAEVERLRGLVGEALDLALRYMKPVQLPEPGFQRLTPPSPAEEQAWREGVAEITRLREAGGLT